MVPFPQAVPQSGVLVRLVPKFLDRLHAKLATGVIQKPKTNKERINQEQNL